MKKLPIFIAIFSIVFIVGCATVIMQLAGIGISIVGEMICSDIAADDPTLYEICTGITGIFVNVAAGTIEIHNVNGQWVTLTSEPMQFNLMENQGKQQVMTFKENIPAGKYDKVRIDLDSIKIQTKNGIQTTMLPNKELIFDANIEVVNNQKSVVELKLDIAKSLHRTEENKLVFAPVMDVKSRKNVNVQVLDQNKKLIDVSGGVLLDNRKVGMDLNGQMKKDYLLGQNLKLTINNNKITIVEPTVVRTQPIVNQPKVETNTPPSQNTITGGAIATQPETNTNNNVLPPSANTNNPDAIKFIINAKKWLFTPSQITVDEGDQVVLNIVPSGLTFSFAIPQLGVSKFVSGETEVKFTANQAGTFEFECSSCEDWRGMKGTLVVEGDYVPPAVEEKAVVPDTSYIDDDEILGNSNAPVTIIEWSDYECPFCARFFSQTLPLIKSNYIDTGKVRLVYRDFPLSFHPNAQKAAEAAECAGDQGKYWQMHDKLFESGVQGGVATLKQYAQQLGLNTASFNSCLDSGEESSEVQDDFQDGQAAGVQGTPAFLINGQLVSGAQPYSVFAQVIESKLNG